MCYSTTCRVLFYGQGAHGSAPAPPDNAPPPPPPGEQPPPPPDGSAPPIPGDSETSMDAYSAYWYVIADFLAHLFILSTRNVTF